MRKNDVKKRRKRNEDNEIDIITLNLEEDVRPSRPRRTRKRQSEEKKKKLENRELVKVTYLFVTIFLAMMGYLVYFFMVPSKDIVNSPYNVRLDSMANRVVRGQILDRDGEILAKTDVAEDGTETRVYPYGNMFAHVVGYDSNGKSGLESTQNFDLLTSNAFFMEQIVKEFQEKKNIGDNVITTLDVDIQKAAYDALGNYKGAVVVMEASTGKILSMVSKPDFNPNSVSIEWDSLSQSENSVLLNRATQGAYAPGSIFKLVTTLAYVKENRNVDAYSYDCQGEIHYEGTTIHCAKNRVHGEQNLSTSLANSCNGAFSEIGLSLNFEKYKQTAEDLLFNSKLPSVLPYRQSQFQLEKNSSSADIMMTAIGQGKTQVSPYHMALITSAIANGGILMEPYLVDEVESYTGISVQKNMPKKYARLMSSQEAIQLKNYMQAVVEGGTANELKNSMYTVAGKTGTAEYSTDKDKAHSWFVGFTNVDNPEIVISVVVEGADQSGMRAVSVAKQVLDAYY